MIKSKLHKKAMRAAIEALKEWTEGVAGENFHWNLEDARSYDYFEIIPTCENDPDLEKG